MTTARHSLAPHYLRFARALSLATGIAASGCTSVPTNQVDAGPDVIGDGGMDAAIVDAASCTEPVQQPIGDGACYFDSGSEVRVGACAPSCRGGFDATVGPLPPPNLAV
jgi:hypothetical protein